jgi:hypothetical protein
VLLVMEYSTSCFLELDLVCVKDDADYVYL